MSKYNLSKKALEYIPKPISKEYCENILVDMILNNMKIEGQEVLKEDYLKFRLEMQVKESQRRSNDSHE
jgi:hypothetical protein